MKNLRVLGSNTWLFTKRDYKNMEIKLNKIILENKKKEEEKMSLEKVETYVDRMRDELDELLSKFRKLKIFLDGDVFYQLPRIKKTLIYKQFRIMCEYIEVLGERIELEEQEQQRQEYIDMAIERIQKLNEVKENGK